MRKAVTTDFPRYSRDQREGPEVHYVQKAFLARRILGWLVPPPAM